MGELIGAGFLDKSYNIKAVYTDEQESQVETNPTNTVTFNIRPPQKIQVRNNTHEGKVYDYFLNQNYPNPFNPRTKISFSIVKNSFVTLKIYDILGKEMMTIVNETMKAGTHQVEFDGSNLESGVYFYEIKAGNFRDVKKLILLK